MESKVSWVNHKCPDHITASKLHNTSDFDEYLELIIHDTCVT